METATKLKKIYLTTKNNKSNMKITTNPSKDKTSSVATTPPKNSKWYLKNNPDYQNKVQVTANISPK